MDAGTTPSAAVALRTELRRAMADLERAVWQFRVLRREAFAGGYDPEAFDRAVLAVRAAATRARAVRRRVTQAVLGERPCRSGPGRTDRADTAPDPLARLRFARWLVETGRLSEQLPARRMSTGHG